MDRLISERKVLDILENSKKYGERYYSMSQLIQMIKDLPAADKWIPVSEPPKENGKYFVTVDYGVLRVVDIASYAQNLYAVDEYEFADFKDIGGWYDYEPEYGYYGVSTIVAWKPLFEFYEGGE